MKYIVVVLLLLLVCVGVGTAATVYPSSSTYGQAIDQSDFAGLGVRDAILPGIYKGTTRFDCTASGTNGNKMSGWLSVYSNTKVFHTWSTNLGDTTPGVKVYMKAGTSRSGALTLIKVGARYPAISPDGKYIVYERVDNRDYHNLPGLYLYTISTKAEKFIDYTSGGNEAGWKSQTFKWLSNTQVQYETSYGGTWKTKTYTV